MLKQKIKGSRNNRPYSFYVITSPPRKRIRFYGSVFLFMRGGDERDISPVGHAAHAATLHARTDERIYETRAFRVRSLKGESRYLHHIKDSAKYMSIGSLALSTLFSAPLNLILFY